MHAVRLDGVERIVYTFRAMKTLFHLSAGIFLLACLGSFLHAQDGSKEPAAPKPAPNGADELRKGPVEGKLVILQTGQVMQGDIKRTESQICIRKDQSEVWISCERAIRICADWDDAYRYLQTHIDLNDAGAHVRLARWCFANNLRDKAMEQVQQALQLQPGNSDAKQLQGTLERAGMERPALKSTPTPSVPVAKVEALPEVDVARETLVAFATKVQPILMNACANCHTTEKGGKFQLQRVSSLSQKVATEQNLTRVIAYLDLRYPDASPLLVKAVTIHWKNPPRQPPIQDRKAIAFQSLQVWTENLITDNPHLRNYFAAKKSDSGPKLSSSMKQIPFASTEDVGPPTNPSVEVQPTKALPVPAAGNAPLKTGESPRVDTPPASNAPAVVQVEDWTDPGPFNRQYHPGR